MGADINFLPDKNGDKHEKPPVRNVEYTRPEDGPVSKTPTKHGGVFSIFKRREETPQIPPEVKEQKVSTEPIVKTQQEKKFIPARVVATIQEPPKPVPKKKRNFWEWLKSVFGFGKQKIVASQDRVAYTIKPPKPESYSPEKVEAKFDTKTYVPVPPPPSPQKILESLQSPSPAPVQTRSFEERIGVPPPPQSATAPKATGKTAPNFPAPSTPKPSYTEARVDMGPQTQGMSFDVNLVPDDLAERSKTLSRLSLLGLVAVVSIAFVGILYGVLFIYQQNVSSKLHNLTQELSGVQQQIDAFKLIQLDALVLKKRTEEVATLLDRHIVWSSFFSKLEHYTLKNVTITQLNADANGKVSITAGAPSPEIAFEQLNVFLSAKDFVTDAVMPAMPTLGTTSAPSTTQSASTPTSSSIPVEFPTTAPPGTAVANSTFAIELTLIPTLFYSTTTLIDLVQ